MDEPRLLTLAPGVHAWIGVGGNSNAGAIETPHGLIAIDAQHDRALGERFRAALGGLALPVRMLLNTHHHLDHVAGNVVFADVPIVGHAKTLRALEREFGPLTAAGVTVTDPLAKARLFFGEALEEIVPEADRGWFLDRAGGTTPFTVVPPSETFADELEFRLPGDVLRVEHWGPAHSDNDVVIYLRNAGVVFLGDLFFYGRFPWIGDCHLDGWIAALDRALAMDVRIVVPGHGVPTSLKEVAAFRDLLATLRQETERALRDGWSVEAAARDLSFPQYADLPRYREWAPFNIRSAYRFLSEGRG